MKRLLTLFLIPFLAFVTGTAQDIPVEKQDAHSYGFKVPGFVTVKDFEFVSAVTTKDPDVYVINVRALNEQKETDTQINGSLLFDINGQQQFIDFNKGIGHVTTTIKGTDTIKMRAVDTDVTRTGTINHIPRWVKTGGYILIALVLFVIFWQLRKRIRKQKMQ